MQFFCSATDTGGAGDQAHPGRDVELIHCLSKLLAIFALDPSGDATTPWVIRHQHQVAACQRDKGGQGCTFVAALFLFHLNQHLGALGDRVLDSGAAWVYPWLEILTGDFFER